ncbi:MAG: hypothetical protein JNM56_22195 [Planctomycetia bacterium]|nr:hypothetical protein [Planctomycetia bacterium]
MITSIVPLRPSGAFIEVGIGLSFADAQAQRQAGKPMPPAAKVMALIDTGAEASAVDAKVLTPLYNLGIQPTRFVFVNVGAVGAGPIPEYPVTLSIGTTPGSRRAGLTLRNQAMLAHDLAPLGYQAVLGRDVLSHCMLIYDGPGQSVTLAY